MKYLCVLLTLILLLSLCACVDVKAEERSPSPGSVNEENKVSLLPEKTPIDSISGKIPLSTEETSPVQKDPGFIGAETGRSELLPISPERPDGEIPAPEPVEPPIEEQSETASAQEE